MMCRHFAAVQHLIGTHTFLHKGMPALAAHSNTAGRIHNLLRVPGQTRVIHDLGARLLAQKYLCQQTDYIIAFNKFGFFIKQKAAVKIAVPGHAQISLIFAHQFCRSLAIWYQKRIRNPVRESPVRYFIDLDKFKRQIFGQFVQDRAGTAVPRVSHYLQRFQRLDVYISQQMLDIFRHDIITSYSTLRLARHLDMRKILTVNHHISDLHQSRIGRDRSGSSAHELHPVILCRIVTGRYHDPPVSVQMCRREINHLRTALPDIDHITAAVPQPFRQSIDQLAPAQAYIMPDHNFFSCKHRRKNAPYPISHLRIDLCRHNAAHIICFKRFLS